MNLNPKTTSIISTIINIILSAGKILAGVFGGSVALVASGIDSTMDILSSIITYIGLKISEKPADTKHPFGHTRYEAIASYTIVMLLLISAVWIIYESIRQIIVGGSSDTYSTISIIVIIVAIIITELLARLKFFIGNKSSSLSLVADAQHSRADVLSQMAVLVGLFLSRYFAYADSIIAIGVGIYIIYSAIELAKESIESLVDVADFELEKDIGIWAKENNYQFEIIKTRKIGSQTFAEITMAFAKNCKADEITAKIKEVESKILSNFEPLQQVAFTVTSHNIREVSSRGWLGSRKRMRFIAVEGGKESNKDDNERIILAPLDKGKLATDFGAAEYLVVKIKDGEASIKEIIENEFYKKNGGHGVMFVKMQKANKVYTHYLGEGAKQNLQTNNIEIEILEDLLAVDDLYERIIKNETQESKKN